MITVVESESDFRITTDTPYLALTGELWGVWCDDFGRKLTMLHRLRTVVGLGHERMACTICLAVFLWSIYSPNTRNRQLSACPWGQDIVYLLLVEISDLYFRFLLVMVQYLIWCYKCFCYMKKAILFCVLQFYINILNMCLHDKPCNEV